MDKNKKCNCENCECNEDCNCDDNCQCHSK